MLSLDVYVKSAQPGGVSIQTRTDGGILHITLNRPEARNAMSRAMVDALRAALSEAEADDSGVRVIVLRGAGGHFCAGGDIKDMAGARGAATPEKDAVAELNAQFGHLARAYARTPIPVVAVVEGAVMGGGFGLACVADVVLASTTADFRLPETSLGLVPAQIAPFLIERLGYSEAKRLAVTGARLSADAALRIGLVHEVVEPSAVQAALGKTLGDILRCAPHATATTKRLLHRLCEGVTEAQIEHAAAVFAASTRAPEAAEGMGAFLAKRAPGWRPSALEAAALGDPMAGAIAPLPAGGAAAVPMAPADLTAVPEAKPTPLPDADVSALPKTDEPAPDESEA